MTYVEIANQTEVANGAPAQTLVKRTRRIPANVAPTPDPNPLVLRHIELRQEATARLEELTRQREDIDREIAEIRAAFGMTEAPQVAAKPARKAKPAKRKPAIVSDDTPRDTSLLECVASFGEDGGSLGEIAEKMGIEKPEASKRLKVLVSAEAIVTIGKAKGTRYAAANG